MYGDFVHEYKKVLFPSILLHVNRDSDWQQHGGTFRMAARYRQKIVYKAINIVFEAKTK